MLHRRFAVLLGLLAVTLLGAQRPLHAQEEADSSAAPPRYLRLVEDEDEGVLRLEVAVRRFARTSGPGPVISLAASIHIADEAFYRELQAYLDKQDVVVYEKVKPAGTGSLDHYLLEPNDEFRARITQGRLRYLAIVFEDHFEEHGRYPADMDELVGGTSLEHLDLIDVAAFDAWDEPVRLVVVSPSRRGKYDLISLGADGAAGGEGVATDLFFSDQPPLTPAELGVQQGIQKDLADAMGLVFQLDAMDHSGPAWINRDLAIDQIEERLGFQQDANDLFGVLTGESTVARLAGQALRFVGKTSAGSAALKLVGIEILGQADELLTAAPEELGGLMEVLIGHRNDVVLAELREMVALGDEIERVGVIYGAGHMHDLEQKVCEQLGYYAQDEIWLTGVELDLDTMGISRRQVGWIRGSIRKVLDLQLRRN